MGSTTQHREGYEPLFVQLSVRHTEGLNIKYKRHKDIPVEDLSALCDEFRARVFELAEKPDPDVEILEALEDQLDAFRTASQYDAEKARAKFGEIEQRLPIGHALKVNGLLTISSHEVWVKEEEDYIRFFSHTPIKAFTSVQPI